MEIAVDIPGYGLPAEAGMVLIEYWTRVQRRRRWALAEYYYEYRARRDRRGRKAHHLHQIGGWGSTFHAHCEDPTPRQSHYRDVPVGLLEAADEYVRIYLAGGVDCEGLLPLFPVA